MIQSSPLIMGRAMPLQPAADNVHPLFSGTLTAFSGIKPSSAARTLTQVEIDARHKGQHLHIVKLSHGNVAQVFFVFHPAEHGESPWMEWAGCYVGGIECSALISDENCHAIAADALQRHGQEAP